jgi:dTDP-4-dehydrorhamnose 3,5-epimerase
MLVEKTKLKDCFLIHNQLFEDSRGYFFESFHERKFYESTGLATHFVQDNQSKSQRGVLRGLHYQTGDFAQAKLVRVLSGKVQDVVVDVRKNSPTYGQHLSIELSAENQTQVFIPRGFAHGFLVLSDEATFFYKCDNYYNKKSEGGILYNDPALGIDWQLSEAQLILSEKDRMNPLFENISKQ